MQPKQNALVVTLYRASSLSERRTPKLNGLVETAVNLLPHTSRHFSSNKEMRPVTRHPLQEITSYRSHSSLSLSNNLMWYFMFYIYNTEQSQSLVHACTFAESSTF